MESAGEISPGDGDSAPPDIGGECKGSLNRQGLVLTAEMAQETERMDGLIERDPAGCVDSRRGFSTFTSQGKRVRAVISTVASAMILDDQAETQEMQKENRSENPVYFCGCFHMYLSYVFYVIFVKPGLG